MKLRTGDLEIAEVRYYDALHGGIEYTEPLAYALLIRDGEEYENILCPGDVMPVYERINGTTNAYSTDEYFGTKIRQVCGNEESGSVFLLTGENLGDELGEGYLSISEVEDYALNSDKFYYNRADIVDKKLRQNRWSLNKEKFRLLKLRSLDNIRQEKMDAFFRERGVKKIYQK